jgi:hypothetical protein
MESDTLLSTQAAGDWLHAAMPDESPAYWRQALINNRRTDRTPPHRVPFTMIGRGAFYTEANLQAFCEFEKSRRVGTIKLTGRAAEALRAYGGTPYGHPFKGGSAILTITNDGERFIRIAIVEPFMVIAATPEQAIKFGTELVEVGQAAQRINSEAVQPVECDLSGYEIQTDKQDITVMRKKES